MLDRSDIWSHIKEGTTLYHATRGVVTVREKWCEDDERMLRVEDEAGDQRQVRFSDWHDDVWSSDAQIDSSDHMDWNRLSEVGLDTWSLGAFAFDPETRPWRTIERALERGINLIDTAPVYGSGRSERAVGEVLDATGARTEVFLATKGGLQADGRGNYKPAAAPDQLRQQLRGSLERLRTDYVDLFQLHVPDPDVPLSESFDVLDEFRSDGLIRYIGLINPSIDSLQSIVQDFSVDVLQLPYNLFERQMALTRLSFCVRHGIRVFAMDPLYDGLFTQEWLNANPEVLDREVKRFHPGFSEERVRFLRTVKRIYRFLVDQEHDDRRTARVHRDHTNRLATLILRWTLARDTIMTVLAGARTEHEVETLTRVLEVDLTPREIKRIEAIAQDIPDGSAPPEFLSPPPLLPRHNFERDVLGSPVEGWDCSRPAEGSAA